MWTWQTLIIDAESKSSVARVISLAADTAILVLPQVLGRSCPVLAQGVRHSNTIAYLLSCERQAQPYLHQAWSEGVRYQYDMPNIAAQKPDRVVVSIPVYFSAVGMFDLKSANAVSRLTLLSDAACEFELAYLASMIRATSLPTFSIIPMTCAGEEIVPMIHRFAISTKYNGAPWVVSST